MKTLRTLAALALLSSSSALAQSEKTNQVSVINFTNKGCTFTWEGALKEGADTRELAQHVIGMQDLIIQNNLPREMPIYKTKFTLDIYRSIWDSLRTSVRIKMALYSIGVPEQSLSWKTNHSATADSVTVRCASEQQRHDVRDALSALLGSCTAIKDPPSVSAVFSPSWPEGAALDDSDPETAKQEQAHKDFEQYEALQRRAEALVKSECERTLGFRRIVESHVFAYGGTEDCTNWTASATVEIINATGGVEARSCEFYFVQENDSVFVVEGKRPSKKSSLPRAPLPAN
jgi:hypothetical protein